MEHQLDDAWVISFSWAPESLQLAKDILSNAVDGTAIFPTLSCICSIVLKSNCFQAISLRVVGNSRNLEVYEPKRDDLFSEFVVSSRGTAKGALFEHVISLPRPLSHFAIKVLSLVPKTRFELNTISVENSSHSPAPQRQQQASTGGVPAVDLAVLGRLMGADGQAAMRAGLGDAAEGSVSLESVLSVAMGAGRGMPPTGPPRSTVSGSATTTSALAASHMSSLSGLGGLSGLLGMLPPQLASLASAALSGGGGGGSSGGSEPAEAGVTADELREELAAVEKRIVKFVDQRLRDMETRMVRFLGGGLQQIMQTLQQQQQHSMHQPSPIYQQEQQQQQDGVGRSATEIPQQQQPPASFSAPQSQVAEPSTLSPGLLASVAETAAADSALVADTETTTAAVPDVPADSPIRHQRPVDADDDTHTADSVNCEPGVATLVVPDVD